MKAFFFALERVLQLRSNAERERAGALGRAVRDEQSRREALDEVAARLERCGEQAADAAGTTSTAGALSNLNLTVRAVASEVEAAADSHLDAVNSVAEEQERFGQARRERRVVERLRERRHEDWKTEAAREEQKTDDELAQHQRGKGRKTP